MTVNEYLEMCDKEIQARIAIQGFIPDVSGHSVLDTRNGKKFYREHWYDALGEQIAERDARIAELEKEVARLKEEKYKPVMFGSTVNAPTCWIAVDWCSEYVTGLRDKAASLSFAPDPSDPRLGRNSGR